MKKSRMAFTEKRYIFVIIKSYKFEIISLPNLNFLYSVGIELLKSAHLCFISSLNAQIRTSQFYSLLRKQLYLIDKYHGKIIANL